ARYQNSEARLNSGEAGLRDPSSRGIEHGKCAATDVDHAVAEVDRIEAGSSSFDRGGDLISQVLVGVSLLECDGDISVRHTAGPIELECGNSRAIIQLERLSVG